MTITGHDAIVFAEANGLALSKHNDAHEGLTIEVEWTDGDGSGHDGYNVADYFVDGRYMGADEHGIGLRAVNVTPDTDSSRGTEELISSIETAQSEWDGADWTHYKLDAEGQCVTKENENGDDDPVYCTGGDVGCKTCVDATRDAEEASECGDIAIAAIHAGDMAEARKQIERASEIETEYGDDPAWGPVLRMVEEMMDAATGRDLPTSVLARWDAADWDADTMTASRYTYETEAGPIELTETEAEMYAWGTCEDTLTGGCQRGELRA